MEAEGLIRLVLPARMTKGIMHQHRIKMRDMFLLKLKQPCTLSTAIDTSLSSLGILLHPLSGTPKSPPSQHTTHRYEANLKMGCLRKTHHPRTFRSWSLTWSKKPRLTTQLKSKWADTARLQGSRSIGTTLSTRQALPCLPISMRWKMLGKSKMGGSDCQISNNRLKDLKL